MGHDTLIDRANGQIIDQEHLNIINRVFEGDFVGRDSSGAPTPLQSLGTPLIPWGAAYLTSLVLDGFPVDPTEITAPPNRVISGAVRITSEFPDYLRPAGSSASFTILGASTPIDIDVNGNVSQITTDIVKGSLTVAPGSNNTCRINDTSLSGQDTSRFLGENGSGITVDNMGSELSGKIGEFVALFNQSTNEIMYCRIASTTRLDYARRGFFFDSSGDPIPAAGLTNNDVLQILSLGFIFAEDDGVTIDVTYKNPVISGDEPLGPQVGDYWYDLSVSVWKRYGGVSFDKIDRTFIGLAVINSIADGSDCIGTRPEYFSKSYKDNNSLKVSPESVDVITAEKADFIISVDGHDKRFDFSFFRWLAASDFESGFTRTVSRDYWLYITEDGKPIISGYKPYDVLGFLRGWYHPYESWRAVAQIFNNSSDEFELINESDATLEEIEGSLFLGRIILSNSPGDPTNDIDFAAGKFTFDDNTGQQNAPALTKRLDTVWIQGDDRGGLDTGFNIPDSIYHCFAIYNPITNISDYLFSLSAAAPTMPNGYTKKRYIGRFFTDAANNIRGFTQYDKRFIWDQRITELEVSQTTQTTRAALALTVGSDVEAIMNITLAISPGPQANMSLILTNMDAFDDLPVAGANKIFTIYITNSTGRPAQVSAQVNVNTSSAGQIGWRGATTTPIASYVHSFVSEGWIDHELEG